MAKENQDGQEKTEEPTQQRLQKAAEEGQVLTSPEMMVFTTLAMGLLLFMGLSPFFEAGLGAWSKLFVIDSVENLDTLWLAKVRYGFWLVILTTIIFGTPLMIITVLTQAAVGGLNFSNKAYNFKPSKLNPVSGLKRIFSVKGLVQLGKSVLKVALLFPIGALVILYHLPSIIQVSRSSLGQGLHRLGELFPYLVGALLIALLVIAAVDYIWQRYSHKTSLMMTPKEVKDESKQTHGSPEVKAKIRRMQMEKSQESARQRGHHQPDPFCRGTEIHRWSGRRAGGCGDGARAYRSADHRSGERRARHDTSYSRAGACALLHKRNRR